MTVVLFWLPSLNINKNKMKQEEFIKSLEILKQTFEILKQWKQIC